MKKLKTMNANATMMTMPIQVGMVAILVITVVVAFNAAPQPVLMVELQSERPVFPPANVCVVLSSLSTINPTAKTTATVTMLKMNPCNPA